MMFRFKTCFSLILATCSLLQPRMADAQFDLLQSLFQKRPQPQNLFAGYAQLGQATQQAEKEEIHESLRSVRDAFKAGGAREGLGNQDSMTITQMMVPLLKVWAAKDAPPGEVAAILRDIVLPVTPTNDVAPYATPWQPVSDPYLMARSNGRISVPESIAAEMVHWSVQTKEAELVRERLTGRIDSPKNRRMARVIAVQLAVAAEDIASAKSQLNELVALAK
jgi:hypothetical protein